MFLCHVKDGLSTPPPSACVCQAKKEEKLEAVDVGHVRHEFDTWKSEGRWTPINLAIVALIHLGKKIIKKKNGEKETNLYSFLSIISKSL